jgi:hypothetical protein
MATLFLLLSAQTDIRFLPFKFHILGAAKQAQVTAVPLEPGKTRWISCKSE